MSRIFPDGNFENWTQCQVLLPHVEPILSEEPLNGKELVNWAQVLQNAAWYLWNQGLYVQAEVMVRRSICAQERVLGAEDERTLNGVGILAFLQLDQGKYQDSEQTSRRARDGGMA